MNCNREGNRHDNLSTNNLKRYGRQNSSTAVRDRPNHLGRASSIAAFDWDTCRISFTIKNRHAKKTGTDFNGREHGVTFSSGVGSRFTDTDAYPQKDDSCNVSHSHSTSGRVTDASQIQTQIPTSVQTKEVAIADYAYRPLNTA